MPVRIPETLPARLTLESENIFVMGEARARHQDIRPLRLAILNLMPTKIATETQLLRLLGNSPLQVEVTLLHTASHESMNVAAEHLITHYKSFAQVRRQKFDGFIITGAPVELLPFEEVDYWPELTGILDWAETNVFSMLYICWGAQAGLYHHYGIPKYNLPEKMFGVFPHHVFDRYHKLMRGFDDVFLAPHSRHTEVRRQAHDVPDGLVRLGGPPPLEVLECGDLHLGHPLFLHAAPPSDDRLHRFLEGERADRLHGEAAKVGQGNPEPFRHPSDLSGDLDE